MKNKFIVLALGSITLFTNCNTTTTPPTPPTPIRYIYKYSLENNVIHYGCFTPAEWMVYKDKKNKDASSKGMRSRNHTSSYYFWFGEENEKESGKVPCVEYYVGTEFPK